MSSNLNIPSSHIDSAPTPANSFVQSGLTAPQPSSTKPTVEDVDEEAEDDAAGFNPASLLAQNPALMNLVQGKLAKLDGRPSGYLESLPQEVKARIDGLKGLQVEHAKVETQFQLEILALEKRFAALYEPIYTRRSAIIAGKVEPTSEEIEAGQAADSECGDSDCESSHGKITEINDSASSGEDKVAGIPEFWLTALKNSRSIVELITEEDEAALAHLEDIQLSYLEDAKPGFKLTFVFGENDFFENKSLEKTYYYQEEVGYGGDFVYERATGTEIKWKEDKNLTQTTEIKKQRNKSTNKTRIVKKVVPNDSFFNFFSPPSPPSIEALEAGDIDEEELEILDEKLELDYQVGEDLKERVVPKAIDFFTGKVLEYEGDDSEEGDFADGGDFSDEDDDDEDDDDEDGPAQPHGGEDPQQCKQQ